MDITLILTIVFFLSAIAGIVWVNKDNTKLMQVYVNELQAENKRLHKQIIELLENERKRILKKAEAQEPEHELQGELEATDDTYNRIIQEWIYGAEAEEEGGIDGQSN